MDAPPSERLRERLTEESLSWDLTSTDVDPYSAGK